jgi:hypothetical protein
MKQESYKQLRARVEQEQAPTVREGLEDWNSHYYQAQEECDCYECYYRREARYREAQRQKVG